MTDIVERLTAAIDFFVQPPPPKLPPPNDPIDILLSDARSEIERVSELCSNREEFIAERGLWKEFSQWCSEPWPEKTAAAEHE